MDSHGFSRILTVKIQISEMPAHQTALTACTFKNKASIFCCNYGAFNHMRINNCSLHWLAATVLPDCAKLPIV